MGALSVLSVLPLPSSDPTGCPSSGRRSTPLLTRSLPIDSIHSLSRANSHSFLPNPNRNHTRNHISKHSNRSLSTHGLHILPHSDSRHHHFFDTLIHFLRVLPPAAICSSLEVVMYTDPGLQAINYMCSQHETSLQLPCGPAETFPAHVMHIVPCSQALSF
jgi:hypothetical protein